MSASVEMCGGAPPPPAGPHAHPLLLSMQGTTAHNGNGPAAAQMVVDETAADTAPWSQLWDKVPVVSAHTSRGIEFLERFGQFMKDRAAIEEEYAAKLKSLAKKCRGKKAEDDEFRMFTTASAFQAMLNELDAVASQHEVIGERLRGELLPMTMEQSRQLRACRKKHSQDLDAMEKCYQAKVEELFKQKKSYEKSHVDAQNAFIKHTKAMENMHLSRLELEKAKQNAHHKSNICEQNKQNYAAQLATTNQAKFDHYNVHLPRLLEDMRRLDVERIQFTRQVMMDSVKAETGVTGIIQRCYADMNAAIGTIDPERDTIVVVEQTKTGFAHPLDFQFEDLGSPTTNNLKDSSDGHSLLDSSTLKRSAGGKHSNGKGSIPRKQSLKLFGTVRSNGGSSGSSASSTGEYGHLPPQQRCRKIKQKLEELDGEMANKQREREGMERLHLAYSQNNKMGDPQEVGKRMEQNRMEMDAIQTHIQRFNNLLLEAQSELNQPLGGGGGGANSQNTATSNSTVGSSPGSSPRGSAASMSNNNGQHNSATRLNGGGPLERGSSYSEASSISSLDNTGGGTPAQHQQLNGSRSTFLQQPTSPPASAAQQSASGTTATSGTGSNSNIGTALSYTSGFSSSGGGGGPTPVSSSSQQQMQHIDSGPSDFYEECDTSASAGGTAPNGGKNNQQQSDMVLGTALAVYQYDASPDEVGGTTISMREGDDLLLLERDVGDGWTRVRHVRSNAEGFVPTSYLDCKWYPAH